MSATLTSHFAGNKATLFDFQLAEKMNKDYHITIKEFKKYPYFSSASWTSFKISLATLFIGGMVVSFGVNFGNYYPSAAYRGNFQDMGS